MVFRERVPDMRFYRGFCALQNHRYFASIGGFFYVFRSKQHIFTVIRERAPRPLFYGVCCALLKPRKNASIGRFSALNLAIMIHFYGVS